MQPPIVPDRRRGYLFVLSWFPESLIGGVNQAVLHLIRLMDRDSRYQPFLLVSNGSPIPSVCPHIGAPVLSMSLRDPVYGTRPIRAMLSFCLRLPMTLHALRALLRERDIDVINCVFPDLECLNFVILRRLGLFPGGKVILTLQGNDIKMALDKTGFARHLAKFLFRAADHVVACSEGIRGDLLELEPCCKGNSSVIHNSIDAEAFEAKASQDFQLPELLQQRPFLLNVGRYEHKKGQDVLIRAFQQIAGRFPDLLLVMIGASVDGESEPIRKLVGESGLADRIRMLENVPNNQVPIYLKAARVFVLPSRREGLPFALLEAGVCRAPAVAAACVGVPEVIEDGVTGRLVPVDDADRLAAAMADLLTDEEESRRLGENLHRLVTEKFTWEGAYKNYLRLSANEGGNS